MTLHGLPAEFEQFVERARVALNQEITAAKKIVAAANAEKGSAQAALSDLQAQIKSAQSQLDEIHNELGKAYTLAGLNREITAVGKKLKALQAEMAEATTALEALAKQRADGERRLVALGNEANRMLGIRAEAEAVYADIKSKLNSVSLGRSMSQ
jgi:chromosome segregation ATPase